MIIESYYVRAITLHTHTQSRIINYIDIRGTPDVSINKLIREREEATRAGDHVILYRMELACILMEYKYKKKLNCRIEELLALYYMYMYIGMYIYHYIYH